MNEKANGSSFAQSKTNENTNHDVDDKDNNNGK